MSNESVGLRQIAKLLETNAVSEKLELEPEFIFLTNNSGINLWLYDFRQSKTEEVQNQLISGYLTAFVKIMEQIFNTKEKTYNLLAFNEHHIITVQLDQLMLYLSFKGNYKEADNYLTEFISELDHSEAWWNLTKMVPKLNNNNRRELDSIATSIFK